jgi:hypothetical protein
MISLITSGHKGYGMGNGEEESEVRKLERMLMEAIWKK